MTHVVQLEAFEASIRSRMIRWFIDPGSPCSYPPGFHDQCCIESPTFQRRILIGSHESSEAWKLVDKWDVVLFPTTGTDWSILLTIILNQTPPCLVIFTPEVAVPLAFFQKLQKVGKPGGPTLVYFRKLTLETLTTSITFDATFFPPMTTDQSNSMECTNIILQKLVSSNTLRNFVLRDAVRDLQSAGATLAISSIEDSIPTLYWYYASSGKSKGKDLFSSIVQTMLLRDM
jgi:hypothetical protein